MHDLFKRRWCPSEWNATLQFIASCNLKKDCNASEVLQPFSTIITSGLSRIAARALVAESRLKRHGFGRREGAENGQTGDRNRTLMALFKGPFTSSKRFSYRCAQGFLTADWQQQ